MKFRVSTAKNWILHRRLVKQGGIATIVVLLAGMAILASRWVPVWLDTDTEPAKRGSVCSVSACRTATPSNVAKSSAVLVRRGMSEEFVRQRLVPVGERGDESAGIDVVWEYREGGFYGEIISGVAEGPTGYPGMPISDVPMRWSSDDIRQRVRRCGGIPLASGEIGIRFEVDYNEQAAPPTPGAYVTVRKRGTKKPQSVIETGTRVEVNIADGSCRLLPSISLPS